MQKEWRRLDGHCMDNNSRFYLTEEIDWITAKQCQQVCAALDKDCVGAEFDDAGTENLIGKCVLATQSLSAEWKGEVTDYDYSKGDVGPVGNNKRVRFSVAADRDAHI